MHPLDYDAEGQISTRLKTDEQEWQYFPVTFESIFSTIKSSPLSQKNWWKLKKRISSVEADTEHNGKKRYGRAVNLWSIRSWKIVHNEGNGRT